MRKPFVVTQGGAKMTNMEKWFNYEFASSCETTSEFRAFSRDLRRYLKKVGGDEFKLVEFNRNHFYCSGFFESKKGAYIYFDTGDVRYYKNGWHDHFLIRKTEGGQDYTGGDNHYCALKDLKENLRRLE